MELKIKLLNEQVQVPAYQSKFRPLGITKREWIGFAKYFPQKM